MSEHIAPTVRVANTYVNIHLFYREVACMCCRTEQSTERLS